MLYLIIVMRRFTRSTPNYPRGFLYADNFVTLPQKQRMLRILRSNQWCHHLRRQQQYYGIRYYQTTYNDHVLQPANSVDHHNLEDFSFIIDKIKQRLHLFQLSGPNQLLVNKYERKDRLGLHVEDVQAFGDAIVGISIGSCQYLRLVEASNKQNELKVLLEDRSIYVLRDQARYQWMHGIGRIHEGRAHRENGYCRISFTFRDVIETRRKL